MFFSFQEKEYVRLSLPLILEKVLRFVGDVSFFITPSKGWRKGERVPLLLLPGRESCATPFNTAKNI